MVELSTDCFPPPHPHTLCWLGLSNLCPFPDASVWLLQAERRALLSGTPVDVVGGAGGAQAGGASGDIGASASGGDSHGAGAAGIGTPPSIGLGGRLTAAHHRDSVLLLTDDAEVLSRPPTGGVGGGDVVEGTIRVGTPVDHQPSQRAKRAYFSQESVTEWDPDKQYFKHPCGQLRCRGADCIRPRNRPPFREHDGIQGQALD